MRIINLYSNQNTNLQNSLTISTHLTDDGVLFDVYDKDFKKITIDYLDYLNSKVVASECVDYDTKTIKPDESGKIIVKHRMKRKTVDKDDFDLIDLHPDYRLSTASRRIPFLKNIEEINFIYCWKVKRFISKIQFSTTKYRF